MFLKLNSLYFQTISFYWNFHFYLFTVCSVTLGQTLSNFQLFSSPVLISGGIKSVELTLTKYLTFIRHLTSCFIYVVSCNSCAALIMRLKKNGVTSPMSHTLCLYIEHLFQLCQLRCIWHQIQMLSVMFCHLPHVPYLKLFLQELRVMLKKLQFRIIIIM